MFTPTNDPEDTYFMDPYFPSSPLYFLEFNDADQFHDPAWRAENIVSQPPAAGAGDEATSASNKMVSSKGEINEIVEENARNSQGPPKQVSRKRSSKADRHSKIPTKNGLRDRRMRLSLDVARQFFKLQDMLIFDKPSKTVKWLLLQAKSAIEELKKGKKSPSTDAAKSASSTSEGEFVESAVEEEIVNDVPKAAPTKEKSRKTRKTLCPAAKEMRKKAREEARERARERTQQKNQSRLLNDSGGCLDDVMNLYQCHLRPNGALELGDESVSQTHTMKPSLDILFEIDQDQRNHFRSTEGFIGSSSTVTTNWSPLMSINYHQENYTFQANPISEFQFHGTSREPYNQNLGHYWGIDY